MREIKTPLLELALFSILLLNLLRNFLLTNQFLLLILAILAFFFLLLATKNLLKIKPDNIFQLRFLCLILAISLVFGSILSNNIQKRIVNSFNIDIHDGVIITEQAYQALLKGENPYSISYDSSFRQTKGYLDKISHHEETHYTYSPGMFLLNAPLFFLTDKIFGIIDMRINIVLVFLLTSLVALKFIKQKIIFLILFLLNPVFVYSIFYGANEVFILFFLILGLVFLYLKKISPATIMFGVASSIKLLILPFLPLYFFYLILKWKNSLNRFQLITKEVLIFLLTNLIFYLPFAVWNLKDLLDDLLFYHLQGGELGRPIAGYLGIPQLLLFFNLVNENSRFPFVLLVLPISLIFLFYGFKVLEKNLNLSTLVLLFVVFFVIVFSFSRIIQTDYLTFISQVLLLGAFI